MKYACLIYADESDPVASPEPNSAEMAEIMAGYVRFGEEATAAGVVLGGEALVSTSAATSVQVRDGEIVTTDGPFAETKEQLGGFYLLECDTLDDAIAWAAKIPGASHGTIEVRPILEFGS